MDELETELHMVQQSSMVYQLSPGICGPTRDVRNRVVFQQTQIPNRDYDKSRFHRTRSRIETSLVNDYSTRVSMGAPRHIWKDILMALCVPPFSFTRKMHLVHFESIPCIYSEHVQPQVRPFLFQHQFNGQSVSRLFPWICMQCFEEQMTMDKTNDLWICSYCGTTAIPVENPTFVRRSRKKHRPRLYSDDFYKRIVHFRGWLRRLQGKERNKVSRIIIDLVRSHLEKNNCRDIHYWTIRSTLEALGLKRFYANSVTIMQAIRGEPLVQLTSHQENRLINMFLGLKSSFQVIANMRVNMLSYPYVIRKLCELLGWKEMALLIPLLKSSNRIAHQDILWKLVCETSGLQFIPTAAYTDLDCRSPATIRT